MKKIKWLICLFLFAFSSPILGYDKNYYAYTVKEEDGIDSFYLHNKKEGEVLVFCLQKGFQQPPYQQEGMTIQYKRLSENELPLDKVCVNRIKMILYLGYPYNGYGFQEKYKMDKLSAKKETQRALWLAIQWQKVNDIQDKKQELKERSSYLQALLFSAWSIPFENVEISKPFIVLEKKNDCYQSDFVALGKGVTLLSLQNNDLQFLNENNEKQDTVQAQETVIIQSQGKVKNDEMKVSYGEYQLVYFKAIDKEGYQDMTALYRQDKEDSIPIRWMDEVNILSGKGILCVLFIAVVLIGSTIGYCYYRNRKHSQKKHYC